MDSVDRDPIAGISPCPCWEREVFSRVAVVRYGMVLVQAIMEGGRVSSVLVLALLWPVLSCALAAQSQVSSPRPSEKVLRQAISLAVAAEYERALELFRSELRKDPDDPLLNYYVGMTDYKLERFAASTVFFEKAIEGKAPFPQAYYWLARAYLQEEKPAPAKTFLERGLKRFPNNRDLLALKRELERDGS